VAIELEIMATVKVRDSGQAKELAFAAAQVELADAYPLDVPPFVTEEYNSGEYWFTFDVSTATPARDAVFPASMAA